MSSSISSSDSWVVEEVSGSNSNSSAPHLLDSFTLSNSSTHEMEQQNPSVGAGVPVSDADQRAVVDATLATLRRRIQELRHDQREFHDMYEQCTNRLTGQNLNAAQQKVFEDNQLKARKSLEVIEQAIQTASERLLALESGGRILQADNADVAQPIRNDTTEAANDELATASQSDTTLVPSNDGSGGAEQTEADAPVDEEAIAAEQAALATLKAQINSLRTRIADLQARSLTAADEERDQNETRQELQQQADRLQPTSSRRAAEMDALQQNVTSLVSHLKTNTSLPQKAGSGLRQVELAKWNELQQPMQVQATKNKNSSSSYNAFLPFHHPLAGAASSGSGGAPAQLGRIHVSPYHSSNNNADVDENDESDASEDFGNNATFAAIPSTSRNNNNNPNNYKAADADLSFVSIRNQTAPSREQQQPTARGAPQIRLPDYYPATAERSAAPAANTHSAFSANPMSNNSSAMQALMGYQQVIHNMLNEINNSSPAFMSRPFPHMSPAIMPPPPSPYLPLQYHPSNIGFDNNHYSRWQLAPWNTQNSIMPYGYNHQQQQQMLPFYEPSSPYMSVDAPQSVPNFSAWNSFSPQAGYQSHQQLLLQQQKTRLEEMMRQLNDLILSSSGGVNAAAPAGSSSGGGSGAKPKNTRSTKNRDNSNNIQQQRQQSGRNVGGMITNQFGNESGFSGTAAAGGSDQNNANALASSQHNMIADKKQLTMPKAKVGNGNDDAGAGFFSPLNNQLRVNTGSNAAFPSTSTFAAPITSNNNNNNFNSSSFSFARDAAVLANIAPLSDIRAAAGGGTSNGGRSRSVIDNVSKHWIKAYAVGSRGQLRPIYVLPQRIVGAAAAAAKITSRMSTMPQAGVANAENPDNFESQFKVSRRNKHLKRSAEAEDLVLSSSPRSLARPNYFGFGRTSTSNANAASIQRRPVTNISLAEYVQPGELNYDRDDLWTSSPRADQQQLGGFSNNNNNNNNNGASTSAANGGEAAELLVDEELLESLDPTSAQRIMGMFAASRLMSLCADVVAAYGTDAVCLDETLTSLKHLNTPAARRAALEQLKKIEAMSAMASFGHGQHGAGRGLKLFRDVMGDDGGSSRNRARSGGALQEPQQRQAITKVASGLSGMTVGKDSNLLLQQQHQQRSRETISFDGTNAAGTSNNTATDELDDKRANDNDGKANVKEQKKQNEGGSDELSGGGSNA